VKADGFEHCKCVLCHVDDALSMSHDPGKSMRRIQEDFKLKDDKIAELDACLGATSEKRTLENGKSCWSMSPELHVKKGAVTRNVKEQGHGKRLPSKCATPSLSNHAPWLEESPELKADGVQQFQELIGQLWWAVEIGRVDILLETSLLSSCLAPMPRVGHLEQVFHVFGCLKMHPKRKSGLTLHVNAMVC
jgi:hypothetical protein